MPGETPLSASLPEGAPLTQASRVLALITSAVAAAVLVGWAADVPVLKSVSPGLVTMKVNTALCLLLLGLGVAAARRGPAMAAAAVTLAITALTLVEYVAGVGLGIDQLLVADPTVAGGNPPGRMAPTSAFCLALLALSLGAARLGRVVAARTLHLAAFFLAAIAILGYAYDVEQLYDVAAYATMALHTAVLVLLVSLAVDLSLPGSLARAAVSDEGPAGQLVRRFVPLALLGLPAIGLLRLRLGDLGVFGDRFGVAMMAATAASVVMVLTWLSARSLSITHLEERRTREELRLLNESLVEGRDAAWDRVEDLSRQLTREREQFDLAISRFDDLVWTVRVRPDGIDLVFASPNAAGVFGGEVRQPVDIGRAMADMVHPEDRALNVDFNQKMLTGQAAETQFRLTGYDGEVRWLWVRGAPRTTDGERYYDGITSNVTERHQLAERVLELERERVVELEVTQRTRDHFFALAGHELRTPLTVAHGYVDLALQEGALEGEPRRYLEVAARGLAQAGSLVSDFFDLARLDAGIVQVELHPVDLGALVSDAVAGHAQAADAAGIALRHEIADLPLIAGDPERLIQVVDNLLSNALKYTPTGGHVWVGLDRVGDEARLRVSDDGIGIPEAELPLVFDNLYRATTATSRSIQGTGLGLTLTKTLVEAHRGRVTAHSGEGRGTQFEVRLPVSPPEGSPVVAD